MLYVKDKNFISKENTVVTFGKFDGIHNGQASYRKSCQNWSRAGN